MNDRFKFRAWDEGNKTMHYGFQYIKSGDEANDWIIFQSDKQKLDFDKKSFCVNVYPNPYFTQQLKIMQCTGLKDKNRKLIYEGDVVNYYDNRPCAKSYPLSNGVIAYNNACFVIKNEFSELFFVDVDCIEVIGNIHENKDLLNENS